MESETNNINLLKKRYFLNFTLLILVKFVKGKLVKWKIILVKLNKIKPVENKMKNTVFFNFICFFGRISSRLLLHTNEGRMGHFQTQLASYDLRVIIILSRAKIQWPITHLLKVMLKWNPLRRWPSTLAQFGSVSHTIGLL